MLPGASRRELLSDRTCYVFVVVLTLAWLWIYNHARRGGLCDEPGHLGAIHHFLEGKPDWPVGMPMLPGYHFMVISLWKLHPTMETLTAARTVTALISLLGFVTFALAWRRLHGRPAGRATLLFALLPLTQPFTALIYTDMPALAFALFAWWAQVTGRRAFAVACLAGAVAIRQTSLAWAGFFILWEFFRADEPRRTFLPRTAWWWVLLAVSGALIVAAGRLTLGSQHGNDFKFNFATVHFAAALVFVLGLPVWIARAPVALRRLWAAVRAGPVRATAALIAGAAAVVTLALTYANPHIWNRELYWDGIPFTLLRNWPLVWIDFHPWLRVASALNIVIMGVTLAVIFSRQRYGFMLWLVAGFGALPALTNSLVEPRYLIPGAGFLLCFLEIDPVDWRRLAIWWAVLSTFHAPFVANELSLW